MIQKLKDLWEQFQVYNEEIVWKNSPERKELAIDRLTALRAFTSGESDVNPYADLYDA